MSRLCVNQALIVVFHRAPIPKTAPVRPAEKTSTNAWVISATSTWNFPSSTSATSAASSAFCKRYAKVVPTFCWKRKTRSYTGGDCQTNTSVTWRRKPFVRKLSRNARKYPSARTARKWTGSLKRWRPVRRVLVGLCWKSCMRNWRKETRMHLYKLNLVCVKSFFPNFRIGWITLVLRISSNCV